MQKKFHVYNAFAERSFGGNPAGVVPDADDLDVETMQKVACQLNLVETVFVTKAERAERSCRLRYFTPLKELPIAGHPTIAAWACLSDLYPDLTSSDHIQESGAGDICVRFEGSRIFCSQKSASIRLLPDLRVQDVTTVFGINEEQIDHSLPFAAVDAGLGHLVFAVDSLEALKRMRFRPDRLAALCGQVGVSECQVFCTETSAEEAHAHTRNFCPRFGREDPACGNGNAALGAYFQRFVSSGAGPMRLRFEQGVVVNMLSMVEVVAQPSGDLVDVSIGGSAVRMVEGVLYL